MPRPVHYHSLADQKLRLVDPPACCDRPAQQEHSEVDDLIGIPLNHGDHPPKSLMRSSDDGSFDAPGHPRFVNSHRLSRSTTERMNSTSRVNVYLKPSKQGERLQTRHPVPAHHQMIVNGDSERAQRLDDLARHVDVGGRRGRITGGMIVD